LFDNALLQKKKNLINLDLFLNLLLEHNNKRDTYYFFGFINIFKELIYIIVLIAQRYKFSLKEHPVCLGATKVTTIF